MNALRLDAPGASRTHPGHNLELVFLPTHASWLNWIEPEFAPCATFALNGSDHHTHARATPDDFLLHALDAAPTPQSKTSFAPDSVIRAWAGYQTKVA